MGNNLHVFNSISRTETWMCVCVRKTRTRQFSEDVFIRIKYLNASGSPIWEIYPHPSSNCSLYDFTTTFPKDDEKRVHKPLKCEKNDSIYSQIFSRNLFPLFFWMLSSSWSSTTNHTWNRRLRFVNFWHVFPFEFVAYKYDYKINTKK